MSSNISANDHTASAPSAEAHHAHHASTLGAGAPAHGSSAPSTSSGQQGLKDKITGAFNVLHGAGESIRGNFNGAVDAAGDAVAGRQQGSVAGRNESSAHVASSGGDEVGRGIDKLTGNKSSTTSGANRY